MIRDMIDLDNCVDAVTAGIDAGASAGPLLTFRRRARETMTERGILLAFARAMAAHTDRDIPADVRAILDREQGR